MLGKWKRFGAFIVAAACVIAVVTEGARGGNQDAWQALVRVGLIGIIAYLTTFVVWPRHVMRTRAAQARAKAEQARLEHVHVVAVEQSKSQPAVAAKVESPKPPAKPVPEERTPPSPQPRPVVSRPAPGPHLAETPPSRNPRGRRIEGRQSSERDFQWPARR